MKARSQNAWEENGTKVEQMVNQQPDFLLAFVLGQILLKVSNHTIIRLGVCMCVCVSEFVSSRKIAPLASYNPSNH